MSEPEKYYRVITKFSYLSEMVIKARDKNEASLNALDTGCEFKKVDNSDDAVLYDMKEITKEEAQNRDKVNDLTRRLIIQGEKLKLKEKLSNNLKKPQ